MSVIVKKTTRENDVNVIIDAYLEEHDAIAHERNVHAAKALKLFFSGMNVEKIDIPVCRQYVLFRMANGVTSSTAARELTVLRAASNHAIKWKRITNDDKPIFEIPKNLPRRELWLFKDEIRTILSHSSPIIETFIRLCYGTGSRRRAIEELEWGQCDFNRKTINLAKQGERKSNKQRPVVPMGDLFEKLKELHDSRFNQWVLTSNNDLLYEFEKTCRRAGLLTVGQRDGRPSGKITPHILRHSRATHLLEDGVPIYIVAKLLGDTPTTIQRTYGHISMTSLEDEINKSSFL